MCSIASVFVCVCDPLARLVARREERGKTKKKVLRVKKEDLSRILSSRKSKSPKKAAGTHMHVLCVRPCCCIMQSISCLQCPRYRRLSLKNGAAVRE